MRKIRTSKLSCLALAWVLLEIMLLGAPSKIGTIIMVQEDTAEVTLGRLDGLGPQGEGSIFLEVVVAGRKKEVAVGTFRVVSAEANTSRIKILSTRSEVKAGYRVRPARLAPLTASYYLAQGEEYFQADEFENAALYYKKIIELIPDDPLAQRRIRACEHKVAEAAARRKALEAVAYYRVALKSLRAENNPAADEYARRILHVLPEDAEAREVLGRSDKQPTVIVVHADTPTDKVTAVAQDPSVEAAVIPGEHTAPNARSAAVKSHPEQPPDTPVAQTPRRNRMVLVPGAIITMGEKEERARYLNEQPEHKVTVAPFYMDVYEVTNAEYQHFAHATGRPTPPHWKNGAYPEGAGDHPVVQVSWDDANAYAQWAGKRLPTEAEWELAARGTDGRTWPWGARVKKISVNTKQSRRKGTAEVGGYPEDRSPYGIYDMGGNVSEWTADWYKPYPGNTLAESDYGEQYKVLRGGSFNSDIMFARCAFRGHLKRDYKAPDLGFRCVADP